MRQAHVIPVVAALALAIVSAHATAQSASATTPWARTWSFGPAAVCTSPSRSTAVSVRAGLLSPVPPVSPVPTTDLRHPADTTRDGRLAIGEITAYAAAWKKGAAWPGAAGPISIGDVTRAGYLWRVSEAYWRDSGATPLCWKPPGAAAQTVGPEGGRFGFPTGVILDVPAGALTEATVIEVQTLPSADVLNPILARPGVASHQKRSVGGFIGLPAGLAFQVPIVATVPVAPLVASEFALLARIDADTGTYTPTPTTLIHDGLARVVQVVIPHFSWWEVHGSHPHDDASACTTQECRQLREIEALCSDPGTNADPKCADPLQGSCCWLPAQAPPPASPNPNARPANCQCCREGRVIITSASGGSANATCEILSDTVDVTFLDCPGTPTETHEWFEESEECQPNLRYQVNVAPKDPDLVLCGAAALSATVTALKEEDQSIVYADQIVAPSKWESELPDYVAVNPATGQILAKAVTGTRAAVHAWVRHEPPIVGDTRVAVIAPVLTIDPVPTLVAGKQTTLHASAVPTPAAPPAPVVTWSLADGSAASSVLSVEAATGVVTARAKGTAVVRALLKYGGPGCADLRSTTADVAITVDPKPPHHVVVTPDAVFVEIDGTTGLAAVVEDEDGLAVPGAVVTWRIAPGGEGNLSLTVDAADPTHATVKGLKIPGGTAVATIEHSPAGFLPGAAVVTVTAKLALTSIDPPVGQDCMQVTFSLKGAGFTPGTRVRFDGPVEHPGAAGVSATDIQVVDSESLTGLAEGFAIGHYDVVVMLPGNRSVTLPQAFGVGACPPPELRVQVSLASCEPGVKYCEVPTFGTPVPVIVRALLKQPNGAIVPRPGVEIQVGANQRGFVDPFRGLTDANGYFRTTVANLPAGTVWFRATAEAIDVPTHTSASAKAVGTTRDVCGLDPGDLEPRNYARILTWLTYPIAPSTIEVDYKRYHGTGTSSASVPNCSPGTPNENNNVSGGGAQTRDYLWILPDDPAMLGEMIDVTMATSCDGSGSASASASGGFARAGVFFVVSPSPSFSSISSQEHFRSTPPDLPYWKDRDLLTCVPWSNLAAGLGTGFYLNVQYTQEARTTTRGYCAAWAPGVSPPSCLVCYTASASASGWMTYTLDGITEVTRRLTGEKLSNYLIFSCSGTEYYPYSQGTAGKSPPAAAR